MLQKFSVMWAEFRFNFWERDLSQASWPILSLYTLSMILSMIFFNLFIKCSWDKCEISHYRALVSVGGVGEAAPTDFEEDWFCTHWFWGNLIFTLIFCTKMPLSLVCWVNMEICTHNSEILTTTLHYICFFQRFQKKQI